jgi:hypothetical protein
LQEGQGREEATADGRIGGGNIGFQLLKKMGWKDESGLGKTNQGRRFINLLISFMAVLITRIAGIAAPISASSSEGAVGLGKQAEYDEAIVDATKERRRLDVEIDQTEEVKRRRTENASRETALETDLKQMNREFYCEICDKQYKNVSEVYQT